MKEIDESVGQLKEVKKEPNTDWLIKTTEDWVKDRAIHNAIMESISILEDKSGKKNKEIIPGLLENALGISFYPSSGHEYFTKADEQYLYYTTAESKIPFDIDILNKATEGGVGLGTLNLIIGGTGAGKSALMCHMSSAHLLAGRNVLYITLEMSEQEIRKRIDANLLGIGMPNFPTLVREDYLQKVDKVKKKTNGILRIHQYPTGAGTALQFKALIQDLKQKEGFVPDVIFIDYLNISGSYKVKPGVGSGARYQYLISISEEFRELAILNKCPVWSGLQFNRSGYASSDPQMTDVAESFGITFIGDFVITMIATEDLIKKEQVRIRVDKSRYRDKNNLHTFMVGFDRTHMRFYDLSDPFEGLAKEAEISYGGAPRESAEFSDFIIE